MKIKKFRKDINTALENEELPNVLDEIKSKVGYKYTTNEKKKYNKFLSFKLSVTIVCGLFVVLLAVIIINTQLRKDSEADKTVLEGLEAEKTQTLGQEESANQDMQEEKPNVPEEPNIGQAEDSNIFEGVDWPYSYESLNDLITYKNNNISFEEFTKYASEKYNINDQDLLEYIYNYK